VFRVPPKLTASIQDQDEGFGKGYVISIVTDKKLKATGTRLDFVADVYVPATISGKNQPILVEWMPDGMIEVAASKMGKTNNWITVGTKIKRGP
jgi:hypothetical protein